MKKAQFVGGIAILILAALIFLLARTGESIPVAITLTVVGLVLVTTGRKTTHSYDR